MQFNPSPNRLRGGHRGHRAQAVAVPRGFRDAHRRRPPPEARHARDAGDGGGGRGGGKLDPYRAEEKKNWGSTAEGVEKGQEFKFRLICLHMRASSSFMLPRAPTTSICIRHPPDRYCPGRLG